MECKVCGRKADNENSNFCENCGNSFRENYQNFQQSQDTHQRLNQQNVNPNNHYQRRHGNEQSQTKENGEAPVSFKNWLLTLTLPFLMIFIPIPFVGPLAYLVLLAIWAFGNNTNPNKKNWARAQLVVSAVVFILFTIISVFLISGIMDGTITIPGLEGLEGFGGLENFY